MTSYHPPRDCLFLKLKLLLVWEIIVINYSHTNSLLDVHLGNKCNHLFSNEYPPNKLNNAENEMH